MTLVVLAEEPRVKTIRVRGVDLSYVDEGRGEPVVLLHGAFHDYRSWSAQWPELSKRYRAVAYSARYNAPNPPIADGANFSQATDVLDLIALIEALNLGPVHLIGHSRGGGTALRLALERPDLVRSLMLGEPGAPGLVAENTGAQSLSRVDRNTDAREAFERGDVERAARLIAENVTGIKGGWEPGGRDVGQRMLLDNLPREFTAQASAGAPRRPPPFTCDDGRRIKAPTVLITGQRTLRRSQLVIEALQKCMPASERAVLPEATHALQLENPSGFNTIVLEFLARHAGRSGR